MKTVTLYNKKRAPYLFLLPFFALFLIFGLYPIIYSITLSFYKWGIAGPEEFRGLDNYLRLFGLADNPVKNDPFFLKSLANTSWLMFYGSFTQHFIAIPLAILLNSRSLKGSNLFKTTFFLPYITSSVAIILIFSQLFDNNFGWINYILGTKVAWLTDPAKIKPMLAVIMNWKFIGWNTVIYLAGLKGIPRSLYEAAEIDGAGNLQKHLNITLPLLLPIIFFGLTMSIIGGMQIFEEPYVMLGGYEKMGGPQNAGLTTAFYLMHQGFRVTRYGRGSAIAWSLFLIILIFTLINRIVTKILEK